MAHAPLLMWLLMRMLMWLLMWLLMRLSMRLLLLHTRDTGLGGLAGTSLAHAHIALGARSSCCLEC